MLKNPENRGCPFEYVLVRIRSRRSRHVAALEGSPQEAEAAASGAAGSAPEGTEADRGWLWHLMEPGQRAVHAPLFFYHELKPLGLALRRREARRWDESERIMAASLLSNTLRQLTIDKGCSTGEALDRIIRHLRKSSNEFGRLRGAYPAGGIRAFEEALLGATLAYAAKTALHPALRAFFDRLSDMLNLLTVSRQLRWRSEAAPPLVPGGRVGRVTMEAWLWGEDPDGRDAFTAALTGGTSFPITPVELERELRRGMTRLCRRLARDTDGVGQVVEYLWGISQEAHNKARAAGRPG